MPTERIEMRRVREILRLVRDAEVPVRAVARQLGVAPSTVRETLRRFEASGLEWPLAAELTDGALEVRLYGAAGTKQGHRRRAEPDWAAINRELKRKHVTLQILWDEYIELHPDGYRYSRYVAARVMWRRRGKHRFPRHALQHKFEHLSDYRAFKNVMRDGSGRCHGLGCRPEMSTLASAFAFISRSTSA